MTQNYKVRQIPSTDDEKYLDIIAVCCLASRSQDYTTRAAVTMMILSTKLVVRLNANIF